MTHFLRAALSSASLRSPLVGSLELEVNDTLYFNSRSVSVHGNVKILAKCLIMSLEEALDLDTYTNGACQGDLLNVQVVTCDDLKPRVLLLQLYLQETLWSCGWSYSSVHTVQFVLAFVLCSSCLFWLCLIA